MFTGRGFGDVQRGQVDEPCGRVPRRGSEGTKRSGRQARRWAEVCPVSSVHGLRGDAGPHVRRRAARQRSLPCSR